MKPLIRFKHCMLAAVLAGFTGTAIAAETVDTLTADDIAQAQFLADLAALEADRFGAIEGIKAVWGDNADFVDALGQATDEQLIDIQNASSFDEVRAILQGRDSVLDLDGIISTETMGDRTRDLVFTPVVPCRFFDTRFDNIAGVGHTSGSTPTHRSYMVWGTATQLAHQGHNFGVASGPGCPAPRGEPSGIHANFTAVPQGGTGGGNIRAWPVGGVLPNVSLVNYRAGVNIANAASVATRFFSSTADDIWVTTQFHSADSVGDVMGYYYPTTKLVPLHIVSGGNTPPASGACTNIASISMSSNARGYWDVEANVKIHMFTSSATGGSTETMNFYLSTVSASCSGSNNAFYTENGVGRHPNHTVNLQGRYFVASPQTEVIYLNVISTSDTGIEHFSTLGESMHATFHPVQ